MKTLTYKGKVGRDYLEIKVGKRNLYITAVIDNCGCEFVVDKEALSMDIRA